MTDRERAFSRACDDVLSEQTKLRRRLTELTEAVYAVVLEDESLGRAEQVTLLRQIDPTELLDAADRLMALADPRQQDARSVLRARGGPNYVLVDNPFVPHRRSNVKVSATDDGYWRVIGTYGNYGHEVSWRRPVQSRALAVALHRLYEDRYGALAWAVEQEARLLEALLKEGERKGLVPRAVPGDE